MAITYDKLYVSQEVPSSTTVASTYTPPNGSNFSIVDFCGHSAFSPNTVVKIVWKYDHATEDEIILMSTKGDFHGPVEVELQGTQGPDGTRKVAIVLENGEDGPVVLCGAFHYVLQT